MPMPVRIGTETQRQVDSDCGPVQDGRYRFATAASGLGTEETGGQGLKA